MITLEIKALAYICWIKSNYENIQQSSTMTKQTKNKRQKLKINYWRTWKY